jgi:dienelactone hydrolase
MSSLTDNSNEWLPLNPESLVAAPCLIEQTLCQHSSDPGQPRLAKDVNYAKSVFEAWRQEEAETEPWSVEYRRVAYTDGNVPLYGYHIRPSEMSESTISILLFHTAVGPHDVFMLYKAANLAHELNAHVFVADLLSDETGWAWDSDKTKYNQEKDKLLRVQDNKRPVLEGRLQAAIDQVKSTNMAALGWCFGGHAILELAQMHVPGIQALATFHGVFTDAPAREYGEGRPCSEVLICHGTDDPFTDDATMEKTLATLQDHRHLSSLLQLKGAKHGFTNPAQAYNEKDEFDYNQEAANKSWRQAVALLKRRLVT